MRTLIILFLVLKTVMNYVQAQYAQFIYSSIYFCQYLSSPIEQAIVHCTVMYFLMNTWALQTYF
jgi:hypothetical protein